MNRSPFLLLLESRRSCSVGICECRLVFSLWSRFLGLFSAKRHHERVPEIFSLSANSVWRLEGFSQNFSLHPQASPSSLAQSGPANGLAKLYKDTRMNPSYPGTHLRMRTMLLSPLEDSDSAGCAPWFRHTSAPTPSSHSARGPEPHGAWHGNKTSSKTPLECHNLTTLLVQPVFL